MLLTQEASNDNLKYIEECALETDNDGRHCGPYQGAKSKPCTPVNISSWYVDGSVRTVHISVGTLVSECGGGRNGTMGRTNLLGWYGKAFSRADPPVVLRSCIRRLQAAAEMDEKSNLSLESGLGLGLRIGLAFRVRVSPCQDVVCNPDRNALPCDGMNSKSTSRFPRFAFRCTCACAF